MKRFWFVLAALLALATPVTAQLGDDPITRTVIVSPLNPNALAEVTGVRFEAAEQVTTSPTRIAPISTTSVRAATTPTDCSAPQFSFTGDTNTGVGYKAADSISTCLGGVEKIRYTNTVFGLASDMGVYWNSATDWSGSSDLAVLRDAANTMAQRNGTNAQRFNIYKTYTSGSNYERFGISFDSDEVFLSTETAGGTQPTLTVTGPGGQIRIQSNGTDFNNASGSTGFWRINTSGHLIALTDNTYDIGASAATSPRRIYAAGYLAAPRVYWSAGASSSVSLAPANGQLNLLVNNESTGVGLAFDVDGLLKIRNRAQNAYAELRASVLTLNNSSKVQDTSDGGIGLSNSTNTAAFVWLGNSTNSFPAFKRNSAGIDLRLGDDSNYTWFRASSLEAVDGQITPGAATGLTVNASGQVRRQVYKVTVDRTAFVCAATTCDVTIATVPNKTTMLGIYGELTTVFACTATCTSSTLSMVVGKGGGGAQYLVSFDADAATGWFGDADAELGTSMARATAVQAGTFEPTGIGTLQVRLTSGTGNIGNGSATNLSQGSITFYLVTERLP